MSAEVAAACARRKEGMWVMHDGKDYDCTWFCSTYLRTCHGSMLYANYFVVLSYLPIVGVVVGFIPSAVFQLMLYATDAVCQLMLYAN